jgi:hypothetical protein
LQAPGPGSDDARVDLKLLAFETKDALQHHGTPEAEARLAELSGADLWAGTIQDGTARGFKVALEEALSLCAPPTPRPAEEFPESTVYVGKELRRKRDLLVASGGARIRFSRKGGFLLVDRHHDVHVVNCLAFEDRTDTGTLDGFIPREGERPRIFHPGFLEAVHFEQGPARDMLVLEGRLGRRARGYPCRIRIEGRKDEPRVLFSVAIENRHHDHRIRIRFVGLPESARIESRGTPGWEHIQHAGGHFRAATLIRACGRLPVGDRVVPVPEAQCLGWIEHHFVLGGA